MSNAFGVGRLAVITFNDTGTYTLALKNLAAAGVVYSDQLDLGEGFSPADYKITGHFKFETAPAQGELVDIWTGWGDGTDIDANLAAVGAAGSTNDLPALHHVLGVVCNTTSADTLIRGSAKIYVPSRYVTIIVQNNSAADVLKNTDDASFVKLQAIPTVKGMTT